MKKRTFLLRKWKTKKNLIKRILLWNWNTNSLIRANGNWIQAHTHTHNMHWLLFARLFFSFFSFSWQRQMNHTFCACFVSLRQGSDENFETVLTVNLKEIPGLELMVSSYRSQTGMSFAFFNGQMDALIINNWHRVCRAPVTFVLNRARIAGRLNIYFSPKMNFGQSFNFIRIILLNFE